MSEGKEVKEEVGKLALRQEGNYWNAYYTLKTDDDPEPTIVHMGSILMNVVSRDPEAKEFFIGAMKAAVRAMLESITGQTCTWGKATPAPKHEKCGHA